LAWLVAGGIVIAATFFDIYRLRNSSAEFLQSFWYQRFINGGEGLRTAQAWFGVNVFVGVAAILAAALLMFVSRQRRGVMVTASFGIGMLFADVLRWSLFFLPTPLDQTRSPELGFWLLVVAVVVSLVALVFALGARVQPAAPVGYPPSPQPPRWEPQTPRYGVPVQQPPSQPRPPAQAAQPDTSAQKPEGESN
jgi:hypothetical protein